MSIASGEVRTERASFVQPSPQLSDSGRKLVMMVVRGARQGRPQFGNPVCRRSINNDAERQELGAPGAAANLWISAIPQLIQLVLQGQTGQPNGAPRPCAVRGFAIKELLRLV